jgi:hypothetical protein
VTWNPLLRPKNGELQEAILVIKIKQNVNEILKYLGEQ